MADKEESFITIQELKRKPVFKEITIESGHPEITVENLTGKIEDMGYEVSSYGSFITNDEVAEGVRDFREGLEAERDEKHFRKYAKEFKKYSLIGLGVSILFSILTYISGFNNTFVVLSILLWITTITLFILSKPKTKYDRIWIRVTGKIYSGTKAREVRDTGDHKAGITKSASSVYIHTELKFSIGADSEIGVERVREDISTISKYLQKI